MKKVLIIIVLAFSLTGNAQDITDWQVGVNFNAFHFSRINTANYKKDKQDFPNGLGYGITVEKNWNEHWGIKTGFEVTNQNIKYYEKNDEAFNTNIKLNFEYYSAPISIQYYLPLNKKLFLTFNQGIQFSFLKYMKFIYDQRYFRVTYTSDYYQVIDEKDPSQNRKTYQKQESFNENLFGIVGAVGLKGFISDKLSYSTNLGYEYDISDADKDSVFKDESGTPIHNFRIGLEVGLQYHFSIGDRFDKRPHKVK